jgi:hypothetical protein
MWRKLLLYLLRKTYKIPAPTGTKEEYIEQCTDDIGMILNYPNREERKKVANEIYRAYQIKKAFEKHNRTI